MKKWLVGCGALILVMGVSVGVCAYLGKSVMDDTGVTAMVSVMSTAAAMPMDRLEQDAINVTAADVGARAAELQGRPVRVRGRVVTDPFAAVRTGPAPSATDPVVFLAPAVTVAPVDESALPPSMPRPGEDVEVLGLVTLIKAAAVPGVDAAAKDKLTVILGGPHMAMVMARRIRVVAAPTLPAPVPPASP